jgi:hypothetical protein
MNKCTLKIDFKILIQALMFIKATRSFHFIHINEQNFS